MYFQKGIIGKLLYLIALLLMLSMGCRISSDRPAKERAIRQLTVKSIQGTEMPGTKPAGGIYSGEPLDEALYDIVLNGAYAISHPLAQASSMKRTDVFELRDGRILVIFSTSHKLKKPYGIEKILLGSSGDDLKKLKPVNDFEFPSLAGSGKSK
jgi:hypothetical protein